MKKVFAIWLAVIAAAAFFTGCQATPEKEIVIKKDTEQLIQAATQNKDKKSLAQMVNAPERMKLSVQSGKGDITVNADAKVFVPEARGIATVRVKKHAFTQAEADQILQYFIGSDDFKSAYAAGVDDMVEMLLHWKAALAKETDPAKRAQLQANINKIESSGVKVPDEAQKTAPASGVFTENKPTGQAIRGYSEKDGGKRFLEIINNPVQNEYRVLFTKEKDGYATGEGIYYYDWEKDNVEKVGLDPAQVKQLPLSLSAEKAQESCAEALKALDIRDMALYSCDEVWGGTSLKGGVADHQARRAYQLEYVRLINGVPINRTDNGIEAGALVETADEKIYAALWPYERVHFIVDDRGIAEFIWESPYEITETVTEHTALKSFEEIQGVFSKMMLITNAYIGPGDVTFTMDISSARLGLMRITKKNNTDTALLIPVWGFFRDQGYPKQRRGREDGGKRGQKYL